MMKRSKVALFVLTIATIFYMACDKESDSSATPKSENNSSGTGSLSVMMTDAPGDYTEVNVQVLRIEVQNSDTSAAGGGWDTLATNAGIYDLLKLRDSVSVLIANGDSLPVGRLNQMRLILGDSNSVVIDTVNTYPMTVPSGQNTGIKVNVNAEVKAGMKTEILLDFDAEKSVIEKGNGDYSLKPVIKVLSVTYK